MALPQWKPNQDTFTVQQCLEIFFFYSCDVPKKVGGDPADINIGPVDFTVWWRQRWTLCGVGLLLVSSISVVLWNWMYSGVWCWSISNVVWVVLCGAGTLLVSILGPAWRQSRTLGEVAQCIRWSSYYHLMIINLSYHYHPGDHHNVFLTSFGHCIGRVESLRYLKRKEIILLSPFCKSVRPVRTPISHFPK